MKTKALAAIIAAAGALCVMQSAEASPLPIQSVAAGAPLTAVTVAQARRPSCTVEVTIAQSGRVTAARVLSCTDPGLRRDARAAAMRRHFTPASSGPSKRTIRVNFGDGSA